MTQEHFNTLMTIVSGLCLIGSIVGAFRSNQYAKKAKIIIERDSLKEILEDLDLIAKKFTIIRTYINPSLNGSSSVASQLKKIVSEVCKIKDIFSNVQNKIPSINNDLLKDYSSINSKIGSLISEPSVERITNERIDELEKYFSTLQKDLKNARDLLSNALNK